MDWSSFWRLKTTAKLKSLAAASHVPFVDPVTAWCRCYGCPKGVDVNFTLHLCSNPFTYAIVLNKFGPVLSYILTCDLLIWLIQIKYGSLDTLRLNYHLLIS